MTWIALPTGIPTSAPTNVPNAPASCPPRVAPITTATRIRSFDIFTVLDITMGLSTWFSTCQ
jgi:hypothetical protein